MNKIQFLLSRRLSFILIVFLSLASVCVHSDVDTVELVFASGPDESGTVKQLINNFNEEYDGMIHVTWNKMSHVNDLHHKQLVDILNSNSTVPHVIASDVVWTAEFADKKWVTDITTKFYREYDRDDFLLPSLDSASYRLRLWGVPWYADAGLIFYRKDLLSQSGFLKPPETWDELITIAKKVTQDSSVDYGYLFQGAEYEGGAVNAAEFIWSAGGELMQSQLLITSALRGTIAEIYQVKIKSDEAANGFNIARKLITEGVSPISVTYYHEQESLEQFLSGNVVFLRGWPYIYGMAEESEIAQKSIGISYLPSLSLSKTGYSCLGGWNLMITAQSSDAEQSAAWEFIKYMTSEKQQRLQATNAGLLPILAYLYDDKELTDRAPTVKFSRDIVSSKLRTRPKTPFYQEFSNLLSKTFQSVLQGDITGQEAVVSLDEKLRQITTRNK